MHLISKRYAVYLRVKYRREQQIFSTANSGKIIEFNRLLCYSFW